LLGKYLMDSVGADLAGQVPALESLPPHNQDGAGGGHIYVPWWLYKEQAAGKLDFPRGYHVETGNNNRMPNVNSFNTLERWTRGAYGEKLKEEARRYYGSFVVYRSRGK